MSKKLVDLELSPDEEKAILAELQEKHQTSEQKEMKEYLSEKFPHEKSSLR